MGLFDVFKAKEPQTKEPQIIRIPYSEHFRGFKKMAMTSFQDEEAKNNSEWMFSQDLTTGEVYFEVKNTKEGRVALVYVNGKRVGRIEDPEKIKLLETGKVDKVHIVPQEDHITKNGKTETRRRVSVVVHYVE